MSEVILSAKNLSVQYKDNVVLKGVNLDICKGKVCSIIGPNGCGKTTLIRALSRNIKPTSGEIYLDKQNIFKMTSKEIARKIGYLSQNTQTMSDVTVRNLIYYGRFAHRTMFQGNSKSDDEIVDWAIERTKLGDLAKRRINTLSGGERQRAWIAMSLAQKPEILILDEPTTYLDIAHQLEILELLSDLNREDHITILMVLHDITHAARYSDELIVLHHQDIYKTGGPWEILKDKHIEYVFNVEAQITKDEENNTPIFYAKRVS